MVDIHRLRLLLHSSTAQHAFFAPRGHAGDTAGRHSKVKGLAEIGTHNRLTHTQTASGAKARKWPLPTTILVSFGLQEHTETRDRRRKAELRKNHVLDFQLLYKTLKTGSLHPIFAIQHFRSCRWK